ncbi:transcriptional regulator with XRE-family HTH domain [Caulobacter sp. BE264]|uniref:helix-turn-helix transcriptional regulator n=1 Tax=Caulobacter sp. BE264 TaxID=2817724 RepID=UPI00286166F8|nr:helix-turn-helix transcriptional regulator [Caulobacter sp. BE264]MDR7232815.1 transcriptional regulator with XRE-family HTH domain [Caulobacter sp. BE264]
MKARDLRVALAQIGLSQAELARILGRAPNTVTGWVNADEMPAEVRLFLWIALNHSLETAKEAIKP